MSSEYLLAVFDKLLQCYGKQHWWPAEDPFEIIIGAILTQNTAWSNVEKALVNLKLNQCWSAEHIARCNLEDLAQWLKPSGYFNVKAQRLQHFCQWYLAQGGYEGLAKYDTKALRSMLLAVKGIGPETADDILLYAYNRPVFVIDAYTRRIFQRLQLINGNEPYEDLRAWFEQHLPPDALLFNEYHALIVCHAKAVCNKSKPKCSTCSLIGNCLTSR